MDPNGKLGQAGEAMGRAAGALGKGKPGAAVGDQGDALDALRQGAQGLTQQFAQRRGRGGGIRGGDNFANQDPLGRPQRTTGADLGNDGQGPRRDRHPARPRDPRGDPQAPRRSGPRRRRARAIWSGCSSGSDRPFAALGAAPLCAAAVPSPPGGGGRAFAPSIQTTLSW